jgi:hypothetical protein
MTDAKEELIFTIFPEALVPTFDSFLELLFISMKLKMA